MSTFRQIFDRAHQEEESGNWLSAANLYRTLIRIQPDNLEVIVNLGNCHFHQGELGVAIGFIVLRCSCIPIVLKPGII